MPVIHHFLRNTFRLGEPLRHFCRARQHNRIANILQNIVGVGCRIEKPIDAEGLGWKIIIDGTSDYPIPDDYRFPSGDQSPPWDMFKVEWSAGATSIKVHAGTFNRWTGGANVHADLTVDGGGTSADPSDFKTLSSITTSTYICLYATVSTYGSASLTVAATGDTNWPDMQHMGTIPIALVTCAGGIITNVIQFDVGALYITNEVPDSLSINFTTADGDSTALQQLYGYADASETVLEPDDGDVLFPCRPGADSAIIYCGLTSFASWLSNTFADYGHVHSWDNLSDCADFSTGSTGYLPYMNTATSMAFASLSTLLGDIGGSTIAAWFTNGLFVGSDQVELTVNLDVAGVPTPYKVLARPV